MNFYDCNEIQEAMKRLQKRVHQCNPFRFNDHDNFFKKRSYQPFACVFKTFFDETKNKAKAKYNQIQKQIQILKKQSNALPIFDVCNILTAQQKFKIQTERQDITQNLEQLINKKNELIQEFPFDIFCLTLRGLSQQKYSVFHFLHHLYYSLVLSGLIFKYSINEAFGRYQYKQHTIL